MKAILVSSIIGFNYFIGIYYGFVQVIYTLMLTVALAVIFRHLNRIGYAPFKDLEKRSQMPPVSIIIPARNESAVIIRGIESSLAMNYPWVEVIVVNDGSTDDMLEMLISRYSLQRIDPLYRSLIKTKPVKGFYFSRHIPNLLVVDKENGGKADAINCAVNVSKTPYVCVQDADSVLEKDALIRLVTPVVQSKVPVVACGGVVRVLNGSKQKGNTVTAIALPKNSALACFQIVEYLRSFLFGRVGLDALNCNLIISGAFSFFQKTALLNVGGFATDNVAEDMELIVRMHRYYKLKKYHT